LCRERSLVFISENEREREKIIKENGIYGICNEKKNREKKIQL
jgi:hypothetical protein